MKDRDSEGCLMRCTDIKLIACHLIPNVAFAKDTSSTFWAAMFIVFGEGVVNKIKGDIYDPETGTQKTENGISLDDAIHAP